MPRVVIRTSLRALAALALAAMLLAPAARPLAAQKIKVQGIQTLGFGTLLPGVQRRVSPTNATAAGRIDIDAAKNSPVILQFSLPTSLAGPAGATLPLSFAAGDAGFAADQAISSQIAFDPRTAYVATLGNRGLGSVFLGGTAAPSAGQRTGSYSATVTLTVVYLP